MPATPETTRPTKSILCRGVERDFRVADGLHTKSRDAACTGKHLCTRHSYGYSSAVKLYEPFLRGYGSVLHKSIEETSKSYAKNPSTFCTKRDKESSGRKIPLQNRFMSIFCKSSSNGLFDSCLFSIDPFILRDVFLGRRPRLL